MASSDPVPAEGNVDGTQTIRRAAAMLRRIGQSNSQGVGLSTLCDALQLSRSTTHRILKCLVDEGLVRHETDRRRYVVGRLTYELGLAVTPDALEIARWRPVVDRVARRTGVTSYLMSRNGIEATCVLKTEGNSVIRVIPVDVGQRRFLGVGAGSTALLAALDPETSSRIMETVAPLLRDYPGLNEEVMRELVDDARRTGFVVSRSNVVQDVIGIGMAIPEPGGTPSLALSIAALNSQTNDRLIDGWKHIIMQEIQEALS
ncbi:helix-turn-helix domain-containing protein [Aquamicrobium sp. LC103]|uniref:IclR family transcriptional regulator n=1 Tax=Aquamicrobium sp. LC103 TaxID=1120658 RepID=UPI00063E8A4E|nr:helix-turn-helix domain-containing protein [Aquamicrobium sp. LC103]TKT78390.1 MarR family transcriptional regulator [Aquamicrobium sp. LC103]